MDLDKTFAHAQICSDKAEVDICAWHPIDNLFATASRDGAVRIWSAPNNPKDSVISILLDQYNSDQEVPTLEWSVIVSKSAQW